MGQDDLAKCWSGSRAGTAGTNIVVGQKDADEFFFFVEQSGFYLQVECYGRLAHHQDALRVDGTSSRGKQCSR